MPDYTKTVIYVIQCKEESKTEIYVGSTCDFKQRIRQHKQQSKFDRFKLYDYIHDNGGWDNFDFKIYEEYPCENVKQCRMKEREVYEKLKATLNSRFPQRTQKEYRDEPKIKQKIVEKAKQYAEDNKEKLKEYKKQWGETNKERRKETNKLLYELKKDEINQKRKEEYAKNKEEIQKQRKETQTEEQKEKARVRAKAFNEKRKAEGFKRVLTEEQKEEARIRARAYHSKKKQQ